MGERTLTCTRRPTAGLLAPPVAGSCTMQMMNMVMLSRARGAIFEVHAPMVKGGKVGVAADEPPTAVDTTTAPVFPTESPVIGAWHAAREIIRVASASTRDAHHRARI